MNSNDRDSRGPPSGSQAAAYAEALERQTEIREAILARFLAEYDGWRENVAEWVDSLDLAEMMPPVKLTTDFRPLLGLSCVHVLRFEKAGLAYVGYEFGCTWEAEHGLGCMTHAGKILAVGRAETSFDEWIARDDGARFEE